ncbi:MAG: HRDC domain-containing protein [Xanthomonadales bacterium]|jgi:ribonuclease D|nr:HRDC domain-containing protein [Xanthomonadales bacterium]
MQTSVESLRAQTQPPLDSRWLASHTALDDWLAALPPEAPVALDTEFIRRDTWRAKLALIQLAVPGRVALIDPVAIPALDRLAVALADRELILHSASEDLEVLEQNLGLRPRRLFDTQIASQFLSSAPATSLKTLLEARLGVELDKAESRSDWLKRPLSPAQLSYAAADVQYLLPLAEQLQRELEERGLLDALREECARLVARTGRVDPQPQQRYRRLELLGEDQQRKLRRLLLRRDEIAQARDRPRGWILDNALAWAMVESGPTTAGEVQALAKARQVNCPRDLPPWLALLQAAEHPLDAGFEVAAPALSPAQQARMKQLRREAEAAAGKLGIAVEWLAPRRLLEQLARGESAEELNGWRGRWLKPA